MAVTVTTHVPSVPIVVLPADGTQVTRKNSFAVRRLFVRRCSAFFVGNGVQLHRSQRVRTAFAIPVRPSHTHGGHDFVVVTTTTTTPDTTTTTTAVTNVRSIRIVVQMCNGTIVQRLIEFEQQKIVLEFVVALAHPSRMPGLRNHVVVAGKRRP